MLSKIASVQKLSKVWIAQELIHKVGVFRNKTMVFGQGTLALGQENLSVLGKSDRCSGKQGCARKIGARENRSMLGKLDRHSGNPAGAWELLCAQTECSGFSGS